MYRGYMFNNHANLANDRDYMNCLNTQNDKFSNYQFADLRPQSNYITSMSEVGLYYNNDNTIRANQIDLDSNLRNGERGNVITNNKNRSEKTLDTRLYPTMPFTGPGSGTVQTDQEDKLQRGEMSLNRRSEAQQTFTNSFIPLLPEIHAAMNNVDHFVEKNWTRGGISTRSVKQNMDYAKSTGIRH